MNILMVTVSVGCGPSRVWECIKEVTYST